MAMQKPQNPPQTGRPMGDGAVSATAQENENLIRRMFTTLNEHNPNKLLQFIAEDCVITNVALNKTHNGHPGFMEFMNVWLTAFPDYRLEVTNIVATADRCVVEFTARATHTGMLPGPMGNLPGTNRKVELKFVDSYELSNGKIRRGRTYFDTGSLLSQIGLMKA